MKKIAIIGSCVTRDLFNDIRLKKTCEVEFYAFQNNIWDLFNESLEISPFLINTIPLENFTRRMVDYDLNKTAITALESKQTDYLIIDMFVIWRECLKIISGKKTIYFKNNRAALIEKYLNNMKLDLKTQMINYQDVDESLIYNGLTKLAEWINNHYTPDKVILHYPIFCKRYWNLENRLVKYSDKDRANAEKRYGIVKNYTDFLASLIPGCKKLEPESFNPNACSVYLGTDDISLLPNPVHCSPKDLIVTCTNLLTLLDENLPSNLINSMNDEMIVIHNKNVKLLKSIERLSKSTLTSLNNYVNNILDLENQIVLISTKNQASEYIHKFFAKSQLGLEMPIKRFESYVAIIDKRRKTYLEEVSANPVALDYEVHNHKIHLESNFKENNTIISVDNKNYTTNRRGLNFVILNNETLEVVDSFFCDTYADEFLLISPTKVKK